MSFCKSVYETACEPVLKMLEAAEKYPERTAYIYGEQSITFRQLKNGAISVAAQIGDDFSPVVIYGHKSPLYIISVFACLICGRTYIPCDVSCPSERLADIIRLSGASLMLLTETDNSSVDIPIIGKSRLAEISAGETELVLRENKNKTAYIIFTSGSTGRPKGIPVSIDSLEGFIDYGTDILPSAGIFAGHALFSFDLSVADIFLSITRGCTFMAIDEPIQGDYSILICTPTFLRFCLCGTAFCRENQPKLEAVLCCGEVLPAATAKMLLKRFDGIRLINAYGPAECCCFVCASDIKPEDTDNQLPVGDMDNTACNIEIRNREIFISGRSAGTHYLGGYKGGFRDDGFYTGDGGIIKNGRLYFTGRLDSTMIKYSGFRIELGEIEHHMSMIDGIDSCICTADTDEHGQARIIRAFAVTELSVSEIKKQLESKLPHYMIPRIITKVNSLPVSINGKCDRNMLKEQKGSGIDEQL